MINTVLYFKGIGPLLVVCVLTDYYPKNLSTISQTDPVVPCVVVVSAVSSVSSELFHRGNQIL